EAQGSAAEHHLPDLQLRAKGLLAAFRFYAGDVTGAIRECLPALETYWRFAFPPNRAQQCFHDLYLASESLGWNHAAAAFARDKISIMFGTEEVLMEARGRVVLAQLSMENGDHGAARAQLDAAQKLLASRNADNRPMVED